LNENKETKNGKKFAEFVLTDPTILFNKTFEGESNSEQEEIKRFFDNHACNTFCKKLKLDKPNFI